MSSMYLLKEHEGKRPGEVVSVPFGEGKRLIAAGVACYWNGGQNLPTVPIAVANVATANVATETPQNRQRRRQQQSAGIERQPSADAPQQDQK